MIVHKFRQSSFFAFFVFLFFIPQCRGTEQREIAKLLLDAYKYTTSVNFVLSQISYYNHHVGTEQSWGDARNYRGCNGVLRDEINRGDGRTVRQLFAKPPTVGHWYWQEEEALFSGSKTVRDKVFSFPQTGFANWIALIYGMTLPERMDSGRYGLKQVTYEGKPYFKLAAVYPDVNSVIGHVPVSHFYFDQDFTIFTEILERRFSGKAVIELNPGEWMLKPSEFSSASEQFKRFYMKSIELIIDSTPGKPFIAGYCIYGQNGKLFSGRRWRKMQFPETHDSVLFQLPANSKIKVLNDQTYGSELYRAYEDGPGVFVRFSFFINSFFAVLGKWFSGVFALFGNLLEQIWVGTLEYGGTIAFWLAVVIVGVVVILKIRQRRT